MDDPVGALVTARIIEQVTELRRREPDVRADRPEGIHQMRVALRRLRTALSAYRRFLDRSITDPIGLELKWLGAMLATARDAEVQAERLSCVVADGNSMDALSVDGEVVGKIQTEIDDHLRERYHSAYALAISTLNSERYAALLRRLDDLAQSPPLNDFGRVPIAEVLPQRLSIYWEKIAQRVETARITTDEMVRAEELHEVRKWVKRLRYAAEPLAKLGDEQARASVQEAKQLQGTLGDHQDTVAARSLLIQLRHTELSPPALAALELREVQEQALAATAEADFFARWDQRSAEK